MAEPKKTGVCLARRYRSTSNSGAAPRTSSISSRRSAPDRVVAGQVSCSTAEQCRRRTAHETVDRLVRAGPALLARLIDVNAIFEQVVNAFQIAPHADRPRHGRALDLQDLLDLVE